MSKDNRNPFLCSENGLAVCETNLKAEASSSEAGTPHLWRHVFTSCLLGFACGVLAVLVALEVTSDRHGALNTLKGNSTSTPTAASQLALSETCFNSSCMHALGGGAVGLGGSFVHFRPPCQAQLELYFSPGGVYDAEVAAVAADAIEYFRAKAAHIPPSPQEVVVFDIDETSLSNRATFFTHTRPAASAPASASLAAPAATRSLWTHDSQAHLDTTSASATSVARRLAQASSSVSVASLPTHKDNAATGAAVAAVLAAGSALTDASQPATVSTAAVAAAATAASGAESLPQDSLQGASSVVAAQAAIVARPFKQAWRGGSPPLAPVLALYHTLHGLGYSLVFLTGRSEPDRPATARNLLAAGYGAPCAEALTRAHPQQADDNSLDASARTSKAAASRRLVAEVDAAVAGKSVNAEALTSRSAHNEDGGVKSGRAAEEVAERAGTHAAHGPACYVDLILRRGGDLRLASVYKAEARARLQAQGWQVVGNIGDQFSDLVGEASAPGSFKLPNPVYTIL